MVTAEEGMTTTEDPKGMMITTEPEARRGTVTEIGRGIIDEVRRRLECQGNTVEAIKVNLFKSFVGPRHILWVIVTFCF